MVYLFNCRIFRFLKNPFLKIWRGRWSWGPWFTKGSIRGALRWYRVLITVFTKLICHQICTITMCFNVFKQSSVPNNWQKFFNSSWYRCRIYNSQKDKNVLQGTLVRHCNIEHYKLLICKLATVRCIMQKFAWDI